MAFPGQARLLSVNGGDLKDDGARPPYDGPEWLRCFSLARTATDWLSVRGGALQCLDGVRCLSMLWVVYGHSVLWPMQGPGYSNMFEAVVPHGGEGYMASVRGQVLNAAEFSVDSFFWLSGFLGAYVACRVATREATAAWVPVAYAKRYLRLTPVYMYVVLVWWKVLRLAGRGGLWELMRDDYDQCARYWWTNLLSRRGVESTPRPYDGATAASYAGT